MFIYSQWELFCKELDKRGIRSVTAASLLESRTYEPFLVLKHDVETNSRKALELAKIENKYAQKGSYYVQGYLLNDQKNISILKEIQSLGHEVSYHHDVMDSNKGNIFSAKKEFEKYLSLFNKNGFQIKTVCQHGNPIVERVGYTSNRDFFRDANISEFFDDISELMVNFRSRINVDYSYISDAGYGWKIIYDSENNDILDTSDKDISLFDLTNVANYVEENQNIIISTHPHRWHSSRIKAKIKDVIFKVIKTIARVLIKVPFLKKIMGKFYFIAKII